MAKTKTRETIFSRSEAAISDGSSKQCKKLIAELAAIESDERAERERCRPAGREMRYHADGRSYEATTDPGPDWQAAADAGDHEEAARLAERFRVLQHRADRAAQLRKQLEERRKAAEAEEDRAAAPKRLETDLAALEEDAEELARLRSEYEGRMGEAEARVRRIARDREMIGFEEAPAVPPVTFRAVGVELGHGVRRWDALFRSAEMALRYGRELLPAPQPGLIERIRRRLRTPTSLGGGLALPEPTDDTMNSEMAAWHRERVRLIAAGDIEGAEMLEPTPAGTSQRKARFAPKSEGAKAGFLDKRPHPAEAAAGE